MALLAIDWYTLNVENRILYRMFLMDAQKERAVVILSSVNLTRAILTQVSFTCKLEECLINLLTVY